jgi:uncharacterized protein YecT (DUF1311 family)
MHAETPLLGPPPMRHVALCLGLIALAAAFTPPAQAQKNEGMGVLGPVRVGGGGPRVDVNKPRRSTGRRAPRRGGCQPANPSGEAAIDRVICANRILMRKDERVALLFEMLSKKTEAANAEAVVAAHDAWLESRKPCADKDKDSEIIACLIPLYDARVRELEQLTGTKPEPPPTPRRRK